MAYRTYRITTSDRERLERRLRNSIIANAARVCSGGLFQPEKPEDQADRIARLVAEDILKDYRLVARK
jgi:hypothetical protein